MEHYTLKNLALQGFGKFISEVFEKLLVLSNKYSTYVFDEKYFKQTCSYLEKLVQENAPQTLANDLAEVMIKMVSLSLGLQVKYEQEDIDNLRDLAGNKYNYDDDDYEESLNMFFDFIIKSTNLAAQVCCAATHKPLTTFKYDEISDSALQEKYLQQMLIFSRSSLKEIFMKEMSVRISFPHLPMLECWSSEEIGINVLKYAIKDNDRLKILNIQMSENKDVEESDNIDCILKHKMISHLNLTRIRFPNVFTRKRLFQGLGSVKESNGSSDCSPHRTELKSLALLLLHEDNLFIPRYLPNITSLEVTLFYHIDLFPLKDLKHLTSLAIVAPDTPFNFAFVENLIQEIGSQLLVLKLFLSAVNFKFIATHCTQLKSFVYYFTTTREQFVNTAIAYGTISDYFTSTVNTVENLQLRLCGEHVGKVFPYILNCFPNVTKLKLHSFIEVDTQNISLWKRVVMLLSSGYYEEFIFNDNKVEIDGDRAFITNKNGYVMTIAMEDLKDVIKDIHQEKKIPDMGRKYIVVPRPRFHFPIKLMQQY